MKRRAEWPETLVDAINLRADLTDQGITYTDGTSSSTTGFAQLREDGLRAGASLREHGVGLGERVILAVPDEREFARVFLGCVAAGAIPLAVAPPRFPGEVEQTVERIRTIASKVDARWAVLGSPLGPMGDLLKDRGRMLEIIDTELLDGSSRLPDLHAARPEDPCYIQLTSGTTGAPKPVVIRHENLAANVAVMMRDAQGLDAERDVVLSWVPYFHDMGLVGFLLGPFFIPVPAVVISARAFARHPALWLEALDRFGATVTWGPAFGYALAASRISPPEVAQLDLTRVRIAGVGADSFRCETLREVAGRLAPAGLKPEAWMAAYGMAEATLAVSFSGAGLGLRSVLAEREALARGELREATRGDGLELACCGGPFPGHAIRVVCSGCGAALPDRRFGEVQLSGPSLADSYFHDGQSIAASCERGWLSTGDLGCLRDGELFVLGRLADTVWIGRRGYQAHDIETAVESVAGVRPGGCVAVSSAPRPDVASQLWIAVERGGRDTDASGLRSGIMQTLEAELSVRPERVWILEPRSLPKTTSGKLQRERARDLLRSGGLVEVDEEHSPLAQGIPTS